MPHARLVAYVFTKLFCWGVTCCSRSVQFWQDGTENWHTGLVPFVDELGTGKIFSTLLSQVSISLGFLTGSQRCFCLGSDLFLSPDVGSFFPWGWILTKILFFSWLVWLKYLICASPHPLLLTTPPRAFPRHILLTTPRLLDYSDTLCSCPTLHIVCINYLPLSLTALSSL